MDNYFAYDQPVSGRFFIGRQREVTAMCNLLKASENILIYEPSKTGKDSLIKQALTKVKMENPGLCSTVIEMLSVTDMQYFLLKYGNSIIRTLCTTPTEYESAIKEHLSGTHFVYDRTHFNDTGEIISANWDLDIDDARAILEFPSRLAESKGCRIVVILNEFHVYDSFENRVEIMKCFRDCFSNKNPYCCHIVCGSRYNAMRDTVHRNPVFRGLLSHIPLEKIEDNEIFEQIRKGTSTTGKVIEKDAISDIIQKFENNIWYINQFMSICDSKTKGYFTENIFSEAMTSLLALHEPRFINTMCSLTTHQTNLLRAVSKGVMRLTSADIIRKYRLNSSANVSRIKESLMKKEILRFDEDDNPLIMDVLFKYWLQNIFFA